MQLEALELRPVHQEAQAVCEAERQLDCLRDVLLGEEGFRVSVAVDHSSVDEPDEDDHLALAAVPDPGQGGTGAFGAPAQVDLRVLKGERQGSDEIRPKGGRTVSSSEHRASPPRPD
jgi:hypothetical protein